MFHGLARLLLLAVLTATAAEAHAQIPPPPAEKEIEALRQALDVAAEREEWNRLARQLLLGLDRSGLGDGKEACWLVDRLLENHPEDPSLRWRRAVSRNGVDDVMNAIGDMEYLAASQPDHPLAVRARRALPAMYLRAGRAGDSAAADERLLTEGLADPVAVLVRLAHTYDLLALPGRVIETLDRLEELAPDKVRYDPDTAWISARAQLDHGDRVAHAQAMIRYANVFPRDRRRGAALIEAASSLMHLVKREVAFDLVTETLSTDLDDETRIDALFLRAELNESLDRPEQAIADYDSLLKNAADSDTSKRALERRIDLEVEARGAESALTMLAALVRTGDRFSKPLARKNYVRLLRSMAEKIAEEPNRATYHLALSRRAGLVEPPEALVVSASRLDRRLDLGADEAIVPRHPAESEIVEADRLERAGERREACRLYREARAHAHLIGALPRPSAEWLGVRIAACLSDEEAEDEARRVARQLVKSGLGEPAGLLAERLLGSTSGGDS